MKYKAFLASLVLAAIIIAPIARADDSTTTTATPIDPSITVSTDATVSSDSSADDSVATSAVSPETIAADPIAQLQKQIADLKSQNDDPSTGLVTKFFNKVKIAELKNKLNIMLALN